ncbi:MAG: alpha-amylase family glycosyl hydrolase [Bacteroidota bacterium]
MKHTPYRLVPWMIVAGLWSLTGCSSQKDSRVDLDGEWRFAVDSLDHGVEGEWFGETFDRSGWKQVEVPGYWDRYNLGEYDGIGWFTTSFGVSSVDSPLVLFFGGVDDEADVWVNGMKIGTHVGYSEPFFLEIRNALRVGENLLVIRVGDFSGPGGIYRAVSLVPLRDVEQDLRTPYADLPARPSQDWVKDAVIYKVSLRSFSREGTIKALERRLPELKELGVTVVWLLPIHPIGELNRRGGLGNPYAVQDYYEINPAFGTLNDFRSLVKSAHSHGLKIIMDLAANHTAWDAKLLMEHPDWYTTNSQGAVVSPNADWDDVADLNYNHHELRKYMTEVMKYWVTEADIDGYRCSVSELVPTDFWERARTELEKIKPVLMLSEGTLPEHHVEAFDLTYSWNLYDVMDRVLLGSLPVSAFDHLLRGEAYQYPQGSLRLRFNTNQAKYVWDTLVVTKRTPHEGKVGAVLVWTFPGVPLLCSGEEVGNERELDMFEKGGIDWDENPEMMEFYKKLASLRRGHVSLRRGELITLPNSDTGEVYSFLRGFDGDSTLVVINFGGREKRIEISFLPGMEGYWREYFSGDDVHPSEGKLSLTLQSYGYRVFVRK